MAKKSAPLQDMSRCVIPLSTAVNREDKGMTKNYRVVEAAPEIAQTAMTNEKGEKVIKPTVMGGNGTVYIARALSEHIPTWVLLPLDLYNQLVINTYPPETKKGKK